jgi:AcrR family transcriptional regulator
MSETPVNSSETGRRRYRSPKRAARALETRRRIRMAAEVLFLRDGYARTTMTAVARAAGVVEKTVYLVFPTKAALLNEVIVTAVRGEDARRPLAERHRAALAAPPLELLARFGELHADVMARTARVMALGESASSVDPQLAVLRDRGHASMRGAFTEIARSLDAHGALPAGVTIDDAADTIYALANESVYLRLIDGCGWAPDRYAAWLTRVLKGALLASVG